MKRYFTLFAMLIALGLLTGVSFAEGPSAWFNMNYTDTKQFEDGEKIQASDNLYQNYYFRLDKSVTPLISYQLYMRSTLLNSHNTDSEGDTINTYQRAIEPAIDLFLRNPIYGFDTGYRRLEQWSTANLTDDNRETTDFYYSRLNITPRALPSFSFQFDRQNNYDHLPSQKIDITNTKYSGSSWYDVQYRDLRLSYNITLARNEDKTPKEIISKTINDSINGLYNVGYSKTFWDGRINASAGYQGNYFRNKIEQLATQTGSVPFKRTPSMGMYGSGKQLEPNVDILTPTITLSDNIYNIPATTTTGTINIGLNGKKFHNTGIQLFSSAKPVDTLFIYVNRDITSDTELIQRADWRVYKSEYNLPNTWTEINILTINVEVFDIVNNIYRYEIKFAVPQNSLFFRAVNMQVSSINDVFVTEIEAYGTDIIPKSGEITDISTFFTQGINFNAQIRPSASLFFRLNYFLNRSDQNPASVVNSIGGAFANIFTNSIQKNGNMLQSNISRNFGATSTWLIHRYLATTARFERNQAFDNKKVTDIRSDTYSLAFNSSPLPTIDTNLSFVRTHSYDFNEKHSMNSLYLLTVGAKLYRDVNMITDIGYTDSKTYATDDQSPDSITTEDISSSTRYIRGTLDARLSSKVSGNLTYGFSSASGSNSSSTNDASLILTYRPGRFFSLSGSFTISDTDDETMTSEGILIDWLLLPAVRLNFNYQHTLTEPDTTLTDSISGYLIWYITRFLDFQFSYNYTREMNDIKKEIYVLGGYLTCRFW